MGKLLVLTLFLILNITTKYTNGGLLDIQQAFHNLMKLEAKQIISLDSSNNSTESEESLFNILIQNDITSFDKYGCFCFFEYDHGQGKGKSIDDIDEMCKVLHDGYTCAILDASDKGDICIPWEVEYTSGFDENTIAGGLSFDDLKFNCDTLNTPDSCENFACKIEGWFVQTFYLFSTSGGNINYNNKHENGFNHKKMCKGKNGNESEKSCCSEYPLRFPYKTQGRSCCGSHTFNPSMQDCCADGMIRYQC